MRIGKPGGGPTQFRGDQRSGSGGGGAVFSLIIFCVRGDQRSGNGGDGAAARTKISRRRLLFRGRIGTGAGGGDGALKSNLPHQLTPPPLPGDRGEKKRPRGARGRREVAEITNFNNDARAW